MPSKFFNHKTKERGFGRELYFTPFDTIYKIIYDLLNNFPDLKNKKWVDPCAADGRWGKIIKNFGIECLSFDIEPLNNDVLKRNFLKDNFSDCEGLFFIGNPPYKLLEQFVQKSLSLSDNCYFLGSGNKITKKLYNNVSFLHRFQGYEGNQKDLRSKVLFLDTNNKDVLVWTCGALFNKKSNKEFIIKKNKKDNNFAIGVYSFLDFDERIKVIKKD